MSSAVVFDLDDTLAVTDKDRSVILSNAADRADVPLTFDREAYLDAHREHSGAESRRAVFESLVDSDAAALTNAYRETVGEALTPIEGAETVLPTLRSRHRLGLLTDGPGETQRDKLRRLGWENTFDAVVVTGPLGAPKPDSRGFETVMETLSVAPEQAVYVGDDPDRDISGAAAAGLSTVQIAYSGGPAIHSQADATVRRSDFESLPGVVDELLGDRSDNA